MMRFCRGEELRSSGVESHHSRTLKATMATTRATLRERARREARVGLGVRVLVREEEGGEGGRSSWVSRRRTTPRRWRRGE